MNGYALSEIISAGLFRSAWFFGYLDRIDPLEAVILVAGVLLLVIELFVPGFGVAGGTGVVLLLIGIALTAGSPLEAFALILVLIVLVSVLLLLLLRSARKGRLARNLILQLTSSRDHGYRATEDHSRLVGQSGVALSDLRPAGVAEIGGQRLDVVTEGGFIRRDTAIKVIQVVGRRIVVEAAAQADPPTGPEGRN